ncbi:MAG TPA: hypothetical protein VKA50_04555 [Gammaproteobacteria bacterium]|nr:hypothetical protein [Gammaproteobacteria bacterium]
MPAPRNRYARHPLMRKGGVHQRSRGGQRSRDKRLLREERAAWLDEETPPERGASCGDTIDRD